MRKILIIKSSSLGDIVHTLPAISDLYGWFPNAQIDWVTEEAFVTIPTWHHAIHNVIPIATRRWRHHLLRPSTYREWQHFKNNIKSKQHDLVIDAQGLLKSAFFIGRISNSEHKHSYNSATIREPIARLFYRHGHRIDTQQHAVTRIRHLVARSCGQTANNDPAEFGIREHFDSATTETPYLTAIHMSARSNKLWPEQHWHTLFQVLEPYNIPIKLPWYTAEEFARAHRLAQDFKYVEVTDQLTIHQTAALLAKSQGCISIDTGFSHVAAALGCRNITLYGPTDPKLIGTYGTNQTHIQSPTSAMDNITPTQVMKELSTMLATSA